MNEGSVSARQHRSTVSRSLVYRPVRAAFILALLYESHRLGVSDSARLFSGTDAAMAVDQPMQINKLVYVLVGCLAGACVDPTPDLGAEEEEIFLEEIVDGIPNNLMLPNAYGFAA